MKRLILIRHAKSSWNEDVTDFERQLNARGLSDAPMMGERLAARLNSSEQSVDALISSSAKRAEQTACLLAKALSFSETSITWHQELYLAPPPVIQEVVRQLPEHVNTVALVAHNPGITELAEKLTGEYFGNVPTCGMITVEFPVDHWLDAGSWADFVGYDYPKAV